MIFPRSKPEHHQSVCAYAQQAKERGLKVIIAGAGGAAHLPGMIAANTVLPVIGVPVNSSNSIDGWDSMLSILQMPYGVPVATVALNGAKNAGILAAQILALHDTSIAGKLEAFKNYQDDIVMESVKNVKTLGFRNEFDLSRVTHRNFNYIYNSTPVMEAAKPYSQFKKSCIRK